MKKEILLISLFIIFCTSILLLGIRGNYGNPTGESINQDHWKDDGPLELSPERGRFALTFSLLEDKSFYFSLPIARFATPDLGYSNGNYVSLFAPGVSFIVMPGYLLGKSLGIAQVGTFAVITLFALLNIILLRLIAIRLGAHPLAATISSVVFIFASPAFAYAVTLYQHHISTFLILASIYILLRWNNFLTLSLIWFLCAVSITVDYPNLFLMFPIGLYALGRIFVIQTKEKGLKINIKLIRFLTFLTIILPISFFLWFNKMSYGNPFQLSGTVPSVNVIDPQGRPAALEFASAEKQEQQLNPEKQQKSAIKAFNPRKLLNGSYTHLLSPDRGIILFTPVMLFGVFGLLIAYKKSLRLFSLLLSIVGVNLLLYSMWGDPYGGWAFGSRYLIPSYAILSIFLAVALTRFAKNKILILLFLILAIYSIAVSTLGAITTSRNPPKVEAVPLSQITGKQEKYTYERNWDYLLGNRSKSFIWTSWAGKHLTAQEYYILVASLPIIMVLLLTTGLMIKGWNKND